jgi:hypothetical protein
MLTPDDFKKLHEISMQGIDRLGYKLTGAMARLFGSMAARDEEVYFYTLDPNGFVALPNAVGGQIVGNVRITQEADFVATRIMQQGVRADNGQLTGTSSWTAAITESGSDRQMSNQPIHLNCLCGWAQQCVPFPKNKLFRRNSTLTITFVNTWAPGFITNIYLAIWGYKIYDEAALNLTRRS